MHVKTKWTGWLPGIAQSECAPLGVMSFAEIAGIASQQIMGIAPTISRCTRCAGYGFTISTMAEISMCHSCLLYSSHQEAAADVALYLAEAEDQRVDTYDLIGTDLA